MYLFAATHTDKEFLLTFAGYHLKTSCDASWGIDDVAVYIK